MVICDFPRQCLCTSNFPCCSFETDLPHGIEYKLTLVFLRWLLAKVQWRLIFDNVICCFTLRLWVVYLILFKFTPVLFQWMFFSSIKEVNRLLSLIMSSIHLKVTIAKNWSSQKFDFPSLKIRLQVSFWEVPNHIDIIEF